MANLAPDQAKRVEQWAADGASLNEIQDRLRAEAGLSLTYLELRMLLIELGIRLRERPKPADESAAMLPPENAPAAAQASAERGGAFGEVETAELKSAADGKVVVTVDQVAVPGALASGRATFSDGKTISWFVDQFGRLGMKTPEPGYQPSQQDIAAFQQQLDDVLRQQGY